MKSRPIAAAFFVVFCLLLCGLILRRQIAAHPLPPSRNLQMGDSRFGGGGQTLWPEFENWRPAGPAISGQVRDLVHGEMTALQTGNAPWAMSYHSRFLRQRISDPREFLHMMLDRHPELVQFQQAQCGQVLTDAAGQSAIAVVFIEGSKGERTRGQFLLVREGGLFKIARIRTQGVPN